MTTTKRLGTLTASLFIAVTLFGGGTALAANYHFVGDRSCTSSNGGTTVSCSFKVAGLGNQSSTASVYLTAPAGCAKTNHGSQYVQPNGLAQSPTVSAPVNNGQITISGLTLSSNACPDQFSGVIQSPVSVYVNGVFVGTIRIT